MGLVAHLRDAASVVGDRAEGIHGQNVGRAREHAHGGNRRPVNALGVVGYPSGVFQAAHAKIIAQQQRAADHQRRQRWRLHANRQPGDDVGRRTRLAGLGNRLHWPELRLGVVLGDRHKQERSHNADEAGRK